jgi:predicted branched-subunit amino acid permease
LVDLSADERQRDSAFVTVRSILKPNRSAFFRGIKDALSLPAWVVGLSVLGIGGLARDVGHPAGAALMSTLLMWAGPAQVILYGGLAAGAALPAIALAVCLSSIRLLPMTMSVLPLLRRPGHGIGIQLLAAHYVAVTVWVESLRRLPSMPVEQRFSYFLGFANTTLSVSSLLTFLGYYLAGALPTPFAAGLLFLTPVFFTISLSAGARSVADWSAISMGFLVTPMFTMTVGRDLDLLATGIFGGTAAYLIGRIRGRSST